MRLRNWFFTTAIMSLIGTGCSGVQSILAMDADKPRSKPIKNPFEGNPSSGSSPSFGGANSGSGSTNETMIFRTRKGDGSVEVEIPRASQGMTDFIIPMSPEFKNSGRAPASENGAEAGLDNKYKDRTPTMSDREITGTFPQGLPEDDAQRRDIEMSLGLTAPEDSAPDKNKSYLAAIDHLKQLYRIGRYEAALMETDELVRDFPTDPRLFAMRGTLLDRLGQRELAIKAWNQSLRFNPKNEPLRRFIERKQQRSVASP